MSASAEREGMELIAAVMHCGSSTDRFESAKALLEYGFSNFTLVDPAGEEEIPPTAVELGQEMWVQAVPMSAEPLLMERSAAGSIRRDDDLLVKPAGFQNQHRRHNLRRARNRQKLVRVLLIKHPPAVQTDENARARRIFGRIVDSVGRNAEQTDQNTKQPFFHTASPVCSMPRSVLFYAKNEELGMRN